ncbi:hypothetical protein D6C86_09373 [Aureobasidium pullulans]|uniref:SET domain-containing protein n=1 Tax=Aureobasidium pullulans TaxID=5580 RepID=A0A4S9VQG8_AURPU|nr:hypothetical protein D6C94_10279 [Aureobasidium pullulans]THZ47257.1 hypothetical protein D6C87_01515 [Aureobasidium pullulans]THZ54540.1 hypothetical protein D6C86_09373 [Aureobasidium pullulans]
MMRIRSADFITPSTEEPSSESSSDSGSESSSELAPSPRVRLASSTSVTTSNKQASATSSSSSSSSSGEMSPSRNPPSSPPALQTIDGETIRETIELSPNLSPAHKNWLPHNYSEPSPSRKSRSSNDMIESSDDYSDSSEDESPRPTSRDILDLEYYMIILELILEDMDEDYEDLTANWIAKARTYQPPRNVFDTSGTIMHNTNPFTQVKPSKNPRTVVLRGRTFPPSSRSIIVKASVSSCKGDSGEVPNYTHYTRIAQNVLGTNTKQLQVWPYFGEETDDDGTIRERFDVIVEDRPRKVLISQQAATYGPYFEEFIGELECPMDDVLKYLLEASEGPDGLLSRLSSYAEDRDLVRTMLSAKAEFCEDDFNRESDRWVSVASSIPELGDDKLWVAALACHAFWTQTAFSPWQIARKYAKFPTSNMIEGLATVETAKTYASIACRICQLHDCPHHGTIYEKHPDQSDSDEDDVDSVDAQDIDYPPRVNFKEGVTGPVDSNGNPLAHDKTSGRAQSRKPKPFNWWMNEANSITWDHTKRGPFFPCCHPGTTCEDVRCTCFEANICCEKTCACSKKCARRFPGCKCARRAKCCSPEDCDCFLMNRECDVDLCDPCEAHIILNPNNRDDESLLKRRCQNVAIQRGIPKRTLLGRSLVHGFGLYAGETIAKGEFIGEYTGEVITRDETERRGAVYDFQKLSYIFDLNKDQTIDSQRMGNKIRFINHAATPELQNVRPRVMLCNTAHRIGMYASRGIHVGEELFFNYGESYHEKLYGDEEKAKRAKGKNNTKSSQDGTAATTKIRPSRKSYQSQPEVRVEIPRNQTVDQTYNADTNDESEDSENDRPIKRIRTSRQRLSSSERPTGSPSRKSRPHALKRPTDIRSSARKMADRRPIPMNSSTKPPTTKFARKSAPSSRIGSSTYVVEKRREEQHLIEEDDEDEDMEMPRRSSRPRKESRRLRGED